MTARLPNPPSPSVSLYHLVIWYGSLYVFCDGQFICYFVVAAKVAFRHFISDECKAELYISEVTQ